MPPGAGAQAGEGMSDLQVGVACPECGSSDLRNGNLTMLVSSLQLRMSKKIAQLTKVIYTLNTRNEDHDMDMHDLAEQYEAEMELILRDTADKINFFKERLDDASDERRVRELARVSCSSLLAGHWGKEKAVE